MQLIAPINFETVFPFINKSICIILHDGTCQYGTLRGIGKGQLYMESKGELKLEISQIKQRTIEKGKVKTEFEAPKNEKNTSAVSLKLISSLLLLSDITA